MRRVVFIAILFVVALALAAGCCACRKGKNSVELSSVEWHLVRMMESVVEVQNDQFNFVFTHDGKFNGAGACNRIMGEFNRGENGEMSFHNLASTRLMCPKVELESKLSEILSRTTHYEIDGDVLMLLSNGEMQAAFHAVPKPQPAMEGASEK